MKKTRLDSDPKERLWQKAAAQRTRPYYYQTFVFALLLYRWLSGQEQDYLARSLFKTEALAETFMTSLTDEGESAAFPPSWYAQLASVLGYVIEPAFLWPELVKKAQAGSLDIKYCQYVFHDFEMNTRLNPQAEPVFSGLFFGLETRVSYREANVLQEQKLLCETVLLIDEACPADAPADTAAALFDWLLLQYARDSVRRDDFSFTPPALCELMARISTADVQPGSLPVSVFDPFCGSGTLLLQTGQMMGRDSRVLYWGQDLNPDSFCRARMNLLIHGIPWQDIQLRQADALGPDWPEGQPGHPRLFDAVVMHAPFSLPYEMQPDFQRDPRFDELHRLPARSRSDILFLLAGLYHLNRTGTLAALSTHGLLFRGGVDADFRRMLVEKNQLDAIIGLPPGLLYNTALPCVLLVLKKQRERSEVLFIDAARMGQKHRTLIELSSRDIQRIFQTYAEYQAVPDFAQVVSAETIRENTYNLSLARYVQSEPEDNGPGLEELETRLVRVQKEIGELETRLDELLKKLSD